MELLVSAELTHFPRNGWAKSLRELQIQRSSIALMKC